MWIGLRWQQPAKLRAGFGGLKTARKHCHGQGASTVFNIPKIPLTFSSDVSSREHENNVKIEQNTFTEANARSDTVRNLMKLAS